MARVTETQFGGRVSIRGVSGVDFLGTYWRHCLGLPYVVVGSIGRPFDERSAYRKLPALVLIIRAACSVLIPMSS